MEFKVMFNFLLLLMYSDRRGTDKTPAQNPPRTIEREFVHGPLSGFLY